MPKAEQRIKTYWIVGIGLVLSGFLLRDLNWQGSSQLHTVNEDECNKGEEEVELTGKILLVEDVLVNQKVALGLMSDFDLDVDVTRNGIETLEKYKRINTI